jgi:hypothetical protein
MPIRPGYQDHVRGGEEAAVMKRTGEEPAVTKAGTLLESDYEGRLAVKAEAGFGPAMLTADTPAARPTPPDRTLEVGRLPSR